MKERLITLGLAAGALALFWILMFPKPQNLVAALHPLTSGTDEEGYAGASRWLTATHIPTLILHRRFDQLGDAAVSSRGNLLIITLPFAVALHAPESDAVGAWVRQGNTLLVLAALDDTPRWSAVTDNFVPDLQRLTAVQYVAKQEPLPPPSTQAGKAQRTVLTAAGREIELRPSGRFGLLEGVRHLATTSPLPSTQWQLNALDSAPVLELARRADTLDPVLWVKSFGSGAMIISAYASVFSNGVIGKADNARLLANITAWSLGPRGRVIFDDAHQGAIDEYDAARFFADPRLHRTLLWLVALWLGWVLASQALRPSAPNTVSLDENAMLRVTARFFAGVLRPVTSAQWLLEEFFDRLRRRHGLPHGAGPPWEWLAAHAGVKSAVLEELRELYGRIQEGRRVSLVRLQRILSQISGQTS